MAELCQYKHLSCTEYSDGSSAMMSFNFLDKNSNISIRKGTQLPHWEQAGVIYFVTFRLADSLPKEKLDALRREKSEWLRDNPEPHSQEQQSEYFRRFSERMDAWLDHGYGSLILQDEANKKVVTDAMQHFCGIRYELDEYVIAANHVHALIAPAQDYQLNEILHSWKSFTAKQLLKTQSGSRISTAPTVWQKESWDHIVRSQQSLEKFRKYIRNH